MAEQFDHLPFERQEPVTERRTRPGFGRVKAPDNKVAYAQRLLEQLETSSERAEEEVPGFDERLLLRLEVEGLDSGELEAIEGLQVVSQEDRSVVVLFADEKGRAEFESRLSILAREGTPKRQDILFAIRSFGVWTPEERMGRALSLEGIPKTPNFVVDVELWPLDRHDQRTAMLKSFEDWCKTKGATVLDRVNQSTTTLVRVRLSATILDEVLKYRDVRMVELPPRMSIPLHLHRIALSDLPPVPQPPDGAPGIVVLDSGLTTAHPLLGPAVGEAQSFIAGKTYEDEHGHGTLVAGFALYGDVLSCATKKQFVPQLRLFSGRITDENNEGQDKFIENQVEEAVRYFVREHGCRIFNVSVGDARRPYVGGHVGPWASILDTLSRELDVLFIVSVGNFLGTANAPGDWLTEYPGYLLTDDARLIDPAPALNVLTVGSLARYDLSQAAARNPNVVDHRPIARAGQPSPFSRSGPTIRQAIKPELVEYGGNWFVDVRAKGRPRGERELGETSTNSAFVGGNLLASDSGTSFAAPKVAHLAGQLLRIYPQASANLLRALIVVHAEVPEASHKLFKGQEDEVENLRRVTGYGRPDLERTLISTEQRVTLVAEARIGENKHHFYEVPIPEDFIGPRGRRLRQVRVGLAHMPLVRKSRLEYRGSEFSFQVVHAPSLGDVARVFRKVSKDEREDIEGEIITFLPSKRARNRGTVQAATWALKQTPKWLPQEKLFVVVTRQVRNWALGEVEEEPYALVVVLEDATHQDARLYSQLRAKLRVRPRQRLRT